MDFLGPGSIANRTREAGLGIDRITESARTVPAENRIVLTIVELIDLGLAASFDQCSTL